ncbi:hypothetical protein [Endozoicomonas elysicola]|uniref:Uncharacterized protein n=1 Tax=Endozoicomonas elysicola TaxID=305900 RepID=A0A081KD60_9GAMM|nr:hypothetical protein [Endozoicomonas elysicola]KEI72086.1 hypothetical protein GV64_16330 [Endozoicomonas elysicola]
MISQNAPTGITIANTLIHGHRSTEQRPESPKTSHQLKPIANSTGGAILEHRECSEASPLPSNLVKNTEPANVRTHPPLMKPMDQLAGMMTKLGPSNPASIRTPRNSVDFSDSHQVESTRRAKKRKLTTSPALEQPPSEKRLKLPVMVEKAIHPQEAFYHAKTSSPATPGVREFPSHSQHPLNTRELISKLEILHQDRYPLLLEERSQE